MARPTGIFGGRKWWESMAATEATLRALMGQRVRFAESGEAPTNRFDPNTLEAVCAPYSVEVEGEAVGWEAAWGSGSGCWVTIAGYGKVPAELVAVVADDAESA